MAAVVSLGTPVTSSRQWTTGRTRNTDGSDVFVAMACQYTARSQWTEVDPATGQYRRQHGPAGAYANSNFGAGGAHGGDCNQLRGPGGRLFFPLQNPLGPEIRLALYEPATKQVYQLSSLVDTGSPDALVYSAAFDAGGSKLYFGGQAGRGRSPALWSVDTDTLDMELIGHAGAPSTTGVTYAYYLAVDRRHLYVAVGQEPWQLVAIDLATRVATTLHVTSGPGRQMVQFTPRRGIGWSVSIWDNGVLTWYWLVDGVLHPYGSDTPFEHREVGPYVNPLPADSPQIDASRGAGQVLTRPAGSTGAWRVISYDVDDRAPVPIESLVALPDDTLLGNAQQYAGFFRVAAADAMAWYGAWAGGVSQPVYAIAGDRLYLAGYPNGVLRCFDPGAPWDVDANPSPVLGDFHATSGMKYPYFLRYAAGRLYCAGRRERDGVGSAIGRYDIAAGAFVGTSQNLEGIAAPRGILVLEDLGTVLLGGTGGVLVHYDLDLAETGRSTLGGLDTTGELFASGQPSVVLGVAPGAAYLYEVLARAVVAKIDLGRVTACAQASDGRVWFAAGRELSVINPATLEVSVVADLSGYEAVTCMAWRGVDLYLAAGATLLRVSA